MGALDTVTYIDTKTSMVVLISTVTVMVMAIMVIAILSVSLKISRTTEDTGHLGG